MELKIIIRKAAKIKDKLGSIKRNFVSEISIKPNIIKSYLKLNISFEKEA